MYMQRTDKHGRPMFNKWGFPLIMCSRGTSDVENFHKQMLSLFGSWPLGIEMADALLAERRHRFNQRVSERKRANFPVLGHYDSWLIDHLQQLVQRNHEILLYPGWSNASDFAPTNESFGVVPLHTTELASAIAEQAKTVPLEVIEKFSPDMKFLMRAMKTELPLLPVITPEEEKLFCRMVLDAGGQPDFDTMAVQWAGESDCKKVFPKLPFHLSTHHTEWLRNSRIKAAVKAAAPLKRKMQELNAATEPPSSPYRDFGMRGAGAGAGAGGSSSDNGGSGSGASSRSAAPVPSAFTVSQQAPMPQAVHPQPHAEQGAVGTLVVGGAALTLPADHAENKPKPGRKKGQKDLTKRKARTCVLCRQPGCPKSNGKGECNNPPENAHA